MKKCIPSKPLSTGKCYPTRQLEGPKTLICNNRQTRNDSSNVQAILHPDMQIRTPSKFIKNIPDTPLGKSAGVYKKHFMSSNTCYCQKKGTRPSFINRPNKCLTLEEFEDKLKDSHLVKDLLKTRNSPHCICKGAHTSSSDIDISDLETLKTRKHELDEFTENLVITNQRKDCELYRSEEKSNYLNEIEDYQQFYEAEVAVEFDSDRESYRTCSSNEDVETLLGTIKSNPRNHSSRFIMEGLTQDDIERFMDSDSREEIDFDSDSYFEKVTTCSSRYSTDVTDYGSDGIKVKNTPTYAITNKQKNSNDDIMLKEAPTYTVANRQSNLNDAVMLKDTPTCTVINRQRNSSNGSTKMRKFRDDNYFETHYIGELLGKDIPKHTCIHDFKLDNRLLPQAVSRDRYGRSRCTVCSKPTDCSTCTGTSSILSDKGTKDKFKKMAKYMELGLTPHDVNIGTSVKTKLKVKSNDVKQAKFIGSYQRPPSINTFALRQQQMSTNSKYK